MPGMIPNPQDTHISASNPPLSYDPEALKCSKFDDQIAYLMHEITVSSLPDEVLSDIFLICREFGMNFLLSLTWICREWRNIALSNPRLWAFIGSDNLRWAQECLTRSKETPLEGSFTIGDPLTKENCNLVLSQLHRFRKLSVNGALPFALEVRRLSSFLDNPAPLLESVKLESVVILNRLFSGIAPSLRSASLRSCAMVVGLWTPNILPFTSLTYLELEFCDYFAVSTLIRAFPPSLPNLEVFKLESLLTPLKTPLTSRVNFPKLKQLDIKDISITPVAELLQHIILPDTASLRVEIEMEEETIPGETGEAILRLLQSNERLQHRKSLDATIYDGEGSYSNTFWIYYSSDSDDDTTTSIDIRICHNFPFSDIKASYALLTQDTESLDLSVDDRSEDDWYQIFQPLVKVKDLTVNLSSVHGFIRFIIATTTQDGGIAAEDSDSDSEPDFPLKELRTVTLYNCDLGSDVKSDLHINFRAFCSALGVRRDQGFGLEKLLVRAGDCGLYADMLRDVVDELDMDDSEPIDDIYPI